MFLCELFVHSTNYYVVPLLFHCLFNIFLYFIALLIWFQICDLPYARVFHFQP